MTEESGQDAERLVVVFDVADTTLGLDIDDVSEVLRISELDPSYDASHPVIGVVRLSGAKVPVIDLAARFDLETSNDNSRSRVMIVDAGGHSVGLIVRSVTGVSRVVEANIELATKPGHVSGVAMLDDRPVLVLDVTKLVPTDEARGLAEIAIGAEAA